MTKPISPSAALVLEAIADLESKGNDTVVYFQKFIKDITRQKIAGWKRSGKVPSEAVDAVIAQSVDQVPEIEPVRIPPRTAAEIAQDVRPDLDFPPATSEFETGAQEGLIAGRGVGKESGEGMTLPPVRPSGVAPRKSLHGPIVKPVRATNVRHSGIETSARNEPEMAQEVSVQDLVRAEVQNLKGELIDAIRVMISGAGGSLPNGIPRPGPRFRVKHWNEPQPAR